MLWHTVGGVVPLARHSLQYSSPDTNNIQVLDAEVQLVQLRAKMAVMETEMPRLIREAQETGRREGEAAGRQAAGAEVQPVLQRLTASMQAISELPARLRVQAEADLVKLAVAIAQRILQRELNVDPAVIVGLVRVGLEKVRMQDVLRVRVCPDQQAAIKECLTRVGASHIDVTADPTQQRGGMVFETSRGKLDVSISTQLQEIERGLTDRLRGQG